MKKLLVPILLVGIILISGCIRQQTTQPTTPSEWVQPTGEVKEFEITARQFSFEPSTITVNKGDAVRLKITSIDVTHGFAINEFNVNEKLEQGKTVNVEFVADKTGTMKYNKKKAGLPPALKLGVSTAHAFTIEFLSSLVF